MKKTFTAAACVVLLLAVMVRPAWAIRIYAVANPGNQIFTDGLAHFLDLGTALNGQDFMGFNTKKKSEVVVMFSAECSIQGGPGTWLAIDIVIDGVSVEPTGSANAFCSGNHTNTTSDGWVSAAVNVATVLDPGFHNVSAVAEAFGGGSLDYWIGNLSMIILVSKR